MNPLLMLSCLAKTMLGTGTGPLARRGGGTASASEAISNRAKTGITRFMGIIQPDLTGFAKKTPRFFGLFFGDDFPVFQRPELGLDEERAIRIARIQPEIVLMVHLRFVKFLQRL